ncbi:MAG: TRAP transporter small permease [Beutenbergiaceae bacterium]
MAQRAFGAIGERIMRFLSALEKYGTMLFLGLVVALVVLQVVTRYILAQPPLWTEEFARYALVWLTFLGAAWLAGNGEHLTVHAADLLLKRRGKIVLDIVALAVQAFIAGVILFYSPDFLSRVSQQHSAAGNLSMAFVYGSITVGFGLMAVHCIHLIARDVIALRRDTVPAHLERDLSGDATGDATDEGAQS